ncbi:MAG: serine/threonine-protein kinase, partial [Gemmatimonadota bacterium]|nr:serine/threonine-protein kinase [Gemmatimonadota bacterium]
MERTEPHPSQRRATMEPSFPSAIGDFRILQIIGEGGMGVVYEAEQAKPTKRRVALKIIKLGMQTKEIEARFDAEQQALAVMDHPNIATVYGGGITEDGRPYIAMELVRGVDLVNYCDTHQLGVADRLDLIVKICEAVQHAHQKGVIHRDLKPKNILVTEHDGIPEPKIIDFGIAKGLGRQLTDSTIVTQHGALVGTPAYMSPEQAEGSGLDVDTRSDVYCIGVIMHELLTGALPLDPSGMSPHEFTAKLILRDTPQPLPSITYASLDPDFASQLAQYRSVERTELLKMLKGDLDWIVLTAIEKNRNRRYQTANGLALDIKRHMLDEPIHARPPELWHSFKKFVRRNKVVVSAVAMIIVVLFAGILTTSAALRRAQRAERLAGEEAEAATRVTDFMVGLFGYANPERSKGDAVTVGQILDYGAENVRIQLKDRPLMQGRMLFAMGGAFQGLGRFAESRDALQEAVELLKSDVGAEDSRVVNAMTRLGDTFNKMDEFQRAESVLTEAQAIIERNEDFVIENAHVANNLGTVYLNTGRLPLAESLLTKAIAAYETEVGPEDTLLATPLVNLGSVYMYQGRFDEADSSLSRSLEIRQARLPNDRAFFAGVYNNMGANNWYRENYDEALS